MTLDCQLVMMASNLEIEVSPGMVGTLFEKVSTGSEVLHLSATAGSSKEKKSLSQMQEVLLLETKVTSLRETFWLMKSKSEIETDGEIGRTDTRDTSELLVSISSSTLSI